MNAWFAIEKEVERRRYGDVDVIVYATGKAEERVRRFEIRDRASDRLIWEGQGFVAKSGYMQRAIEIALRAISGQAPEHWVAVDTLAGIEVSSRDR